MKSLIGYHLGCVYSDQGKIFNSSGLKEIDERALVKQATQCLPQKSHLQILLHCPSLHHLRLEQLFLCPRTELNISHGAWQLLPSNLLCTLNLFFSHMKACSDVTTGWSCAVIFNMLCHVVILKARC